MESLVLPQLTAAECERVAIMEAYISELISQNKGPISFKRFMQEVLYAPKLGYYVSNKQKFGKGGDFMTAPMSSRLFGQTFALQFAKILQKLGDDSVIIEFGAGTGKFALDCLQKLKTINSLPSAYYIIELSPDLKLQQQMQLVQLGEYYANIHWLESLPTKKFNAIIFANEVLDAMPVELLHFDNGKCSQMMVDYQQGNFTWCYHSISDPALIAVLNSPSLKKLLALQDYQTEVNLWIEPWLKTIHSMLHKGVVFICDYGYSRDLYYSQERVKGTLQCYFQHHVHDNPLIYMGLQDITAHVDFTRVAEVSEQLGFMLDGFATQGNFLLQAGILEAYQEVQLDLNKKERLVLNQEVKLLTLSAELSENFKVITLSYAYDDVIRALDEIDISYVL